MKRILVATDGSEGSDRAIRFAVDLAKSSGAEILLVNVIGGEGLPADMLGSLPETQTVWFREILENNSARILQHARDIAQSSGASLVHLEARRGDVARTVIEIAGEKQADLIVVGKRGTGQLAGALLGSVSQKLVSLSPVSVTVVP